VASPALTAPERQLARSVVDGLGEMVRREVARQLAARPVAEGPDPLGVSYEQARELVGVSRSTLKSLVASGTLRARRAGRRVLIDFHSLCDWWAELDQLGAANKPHPRLSRLDAVRAARRRLATLETNKARERR
jgi:excisionase family DNA binding protein